ncbi:MAG TPA: ATP-dependent DNA helicase [Candidatus Paceibacterota bacterium]
MATSQGFEEAYAKLNPAQKKAVDTVEGPVMVIAGPGTGKTHILTLRIANILKVTDAKPDSILALTFTDSAARTVAGRLGKLVGEETARKVGTFTFHSFAGEVIRTHPEAFTEVADQRLMGEVEQVLVWRDVLESTEAKYLATAKSPYHYLGDLKMLEDQLTRECITLDDYHAWIEEEGSRIGSDESLRYVRGEKVGELNQKGREKLERLEKSHESITLIEAYRKEKERRGLYGYTDVLRIVTDALKSDDVLRAELQEKYQYVLADEHQDANALQHALLDFLAFDEHPNLFIVGDEKQAIFGFQGADATHFRTFLSLYPRTEIIALTDNYRSYQDILDLSHTLLKGLPSSTGEHAALKAFRGKGGDVRLLVADDPLAERDQVASMIEEAVAAGVPPHEIAVITLKNKTADAFALTLRARGVPVLRAGDVDLEGRPAIRYLLALMQTVADPNDTPALRESLLAPWWAPGIAERSLLLRRSSDRQLPEMLAETFPDIAGTIEILRTQGNEAPPVNVLSYILAASGARAYFLSGGEQVEEDIPLVRQIMLYIEELVMRSPNATWSEVMETFTKAREHEIGSIKTSRTEREGHVTVITAHKAKGMEFSRVFVAALTAREWEGRGKSSLIPSPFTAAREKQEIIRLFYVALTRAKDELVLSYAAHGSEEKEQAPLSLLPAGLPRIECKSDPLPLLHATVNAPELVCELTLRYLTDKGLAPSSYNEYLKSPPAFFAKYVLGLREPQTRAMVAGTAVHAGIAAYLRVPEAPQGERLRLAAAELSRTFQHSLLPRGDTFDALTRHASLSLNAYLASESVVREVLDIEKDFKSEYQIGDMKIKLGGRVDAVFKGATGDCIVDFKTTGTIDAKKKAEYGRQLAFYDYLLKQNGRHASEGLIIQISEDRVVEHPYPLTNELREAFATELDTVIRELISGNWRTGDPCDYDNLLELFKD